MHVYLVFLWHWWKSSYVCCADRLSYLLMTLHNLVGRPGSSHFLNLNSSNYHVHQHYHAHLSLHFMLSCFGRGWIHQEHPCRMWNLAFPHPQTCPELIDCLALKKPSRHMPVSSSLTHPIFNILVLIDIILYIANLI